MLFRQRRVASPLVLGLSALSAITALALAFALPRASVEVLFTRSLYWVLWIALILLAGALVADRRARGALFTRRCVWLVAGALALSAVVFLAVGTGYRVLADEANLLSTSMSLHEQRSLTNIVEGMSYYADYHVLNEGVASRPGLYPFTVSLLHTFFGYRIDHGFAVNFAACAGTLLAMLALGRRLVATAYGVLAALVLVTIPVFTLSATSAGFDSLNLLIITVFFLQLVRFSERPDAIGLELLLLIAILGGHTRYETIWLSVPALVAGVLQARALLGAPLSWRLPLFPLLLVPLVWQKALTSVRNESGRGPEVASGPTFGLEHIGDNVERALSFYAQEPAFWLALVGLALVILQLVRGRGARLRMPIALIGLSLVLIAGTHMAFYMGDIDTAHNRRLAVAHLAVVALLAAYPLYRVLRMRRLRVALGGAVVIAVALGLSRAANDDVGRSLTLYREYRENLAFLDDVPRDGTLIISDRPVLYVPHRFGSISIERANREAPRFLGNLQSRLFPRVYAIQAIRYSDLQPEQPLDPRFRLETLHEYQNSAAQMIRISRVTWPR